MLKGIAVIGSILWISTVIFVYIQLSSNQTQSSSNESIRNWRQTLDFLEKLRQQNEELKSMMEKEREDMKSQQNELKHIQDSISSKKDDKDERDEPEQIRKPEPVVPVQKTSHLGTFELEIQRRFMDDRIREMFYLLHNINIDNSSKTQLENQMVSLMGLSAKLENTDDIEVERRKERKVLSSHILKSIEKLQYPQSCEKSNVLVCNLDKECGFGCQLHHVTYCAISAFATERMLILKRDGANWKYSQKGWNSVFNPISNCTFDRAVGNEAQASFSEISKARVVGLGIVDSLALKPTFLPQAVPSSIVKNLAMLHSNPPSFFVGTFISYLMRFNKETRQKLEEAANSVPFDKGPIVGLQIRRTDKVGTEAAFHALKEYMEWTEYWFRVEEKRQSMNITRRIFIASDDPTVVPEAKKNYPQYEVYGSTEIAKTAQLTNRYTDASLMGVITDIYILSKVNYLVCTFSSQVCRMGYELRQPTGEDDGSKFHSLDDIYYFGGQQAHEVVAIEDHISQKPTEIDIKIGDKIGIAGNHWDGFSKGTNRRTNKIGVFPSYKVVNEWRTYDFKALLPLN